MFCLLLAGALLFPPLVGGAPTLLQLLLLLGSAVSLWAIRVAKNGRRAYPKPTERSRIGRQGALSVLAVMLAALLIGLPLSDALTPGVTDLDIRVRDRVNDWVEARYPTDQGTINKGDNPYSDRAMMQLFATRTPESVLYLKNYIGDIDFSNLKIGIDCANGATSVIGDSVFKELGAKTYLINAESHYNTIINQDCGSTHLESLQKLVAENSLDFGIAYDGDGDRCLLIDSKSNVVDGDQIIAILADFLSLNQITITVMANQGLLNWAKDNNIKTEITPVGDSNVAAAMRQYDIKLGGEQSGHIILPNEPTGDGILTSLMVARTIVNSQKSLDSLAQIFTKSPQVVLNMPATAEQKQALKSSDSTKNLLLEYSKKLEPLNGRLLVRPSGTEPLIRITMWGDDESSITTLAQELQTKLGQTI